MAGPGTGLIETGQIETGRIETLRIEANRFETGRIRAPRTARRGAGLPARRPSLALTALSDAYHRRLQVSGAVAHPALPEPRRELTLI